MTTELENKLDEDFLFYLGFTSQYSNRIKECSERMLLQQWLQRLCGEPAKTVDEKRNRNIFLSNLILCMQEARLIEPFTIDPNEIDLSDPKKWFATVQDEVTRPAWLDEVVDAEEEAATQRDDGRTYVATRVLPGGAGAFAYVAVSMAEEDPMWLGGGEGVFDDQMNYKFQQMVPPVHEMEYILAKRKDPKERQRVLTFYDVMLQNIADELDEKITEEENAAITKVVEQLEQDLKAKGLYERFEHMCGKEKRNELLLVLFDRTKCRRDKVAKREEVLDDIDATFRASFFEECMAGDEEKYELPAGMWEYAINRPLNKKNLELMQTMYPPQVVEKFMELLSNQKEEIAVRMQRRHANIVSQMKKDLQSEGEKFKRIIEQAKVSSEQANDVLTDVRRAYQNMKDSYEIQENRKKGGETDVTKLYNEMRATLVDTQLFVEEEAERGRLLSEQINNLSAQSEVYAQVTECSIIKTEEANMELMKNIKKLTIAVRQYENRLQQIEAMRDSKLKAKSQQMFIF